MVRTCECGLATDDVALLERHRLAKGHREHVAWPVAVTVGSYRSSRLGRYLSDAIRRFRRRCRIDRPAGPGRQQAAGK
jgi:hypothetical protein